jgi:hypothetical protein
LRSLLQVSETMVQQKGSGSGDRCTQFIDTALLCVPMHIGWHLAKA